MRTVTYGLSLILVFTMPWENVVYLQPLGTISRSIGLVVALLWILTVISTNSLRKPRAFHMACFLFVFWSAVSTFYSVNPLESLENISTTFQLFVLIYIVWDLYTAPVHVTRALQAVVLGAWVTIGSILGNYYTGVEDTYQRFSATGFGANEAAYVLSLSLPLAWHLAFTGESNKINRWFRLINICFIPFALFAILLTGSRAAILSTLPAFLFMLGSLTKAKLYWRISASAGILIAVIALVQFVPTSSLERVQIRNLDDRSAIWLETVDSIMEHPFLGVGAGAYRGATSEKVAHNSILQLLADVGLIGFILFCAVVVTAIYDLRLIPKSTRYLWLVMLAGWLINSAAHDYHDSKLIWLILGLMVASAHISARMTEHSPEVKTGIKAT